jgi:phospholipid/cholesterol/gamma-HCH transport system substrate-binding protein
VDKSAPIRADTLVGLEFAGLTGVSAVSLKGGSLEAGGIPVADDGVPTLTADPNAIMDIGEAVRATLQNVNKLVTDNQAALHDSMENLKVFSKALADNSSRIDSIMVGVDSLMGGKDGEGGELQKAARSFRELADNLDKRSAGLIADGRRTLGDISRAVNNFDRNPTRVLFGASNTDNRAAPPQQAPARPPHRPAR